MLEEGLLVTINSDNPPYFGGYLDANYAAIQEHCAVTPSQLETLALIITTGPAARPSG
jgi:adenosine deaminase